MIVYRYPTVLILLVNIGCSRGLSMSRAERSAHRPPVSVEQPAPAIPGEPVETVASHRQSTSDPAAELHESLLESIEPIGRSLAGGVEDSKVRFEFGSLMNPRPLVCHTPGGHISVSSGMLSKLRSHEELAAVLALEMAELLVERQAEPPEEAGLPSAGAADDAIDLALASKIQDQRRPQTVSNIRSVAQNLLLRAGYPEVDVAAMHANIENWTAMNNASPANFENVELLGN